MKKNHDQLIKLLQEEVKPALGCTEPGAVALAAAHGASLIKGIVEKGRIRVSQNIYKNALGVTIPNTKETGLDLAAALGIVLKNPEKNLNLLEEVTPVILKRALELIQKGKIAVEVLEEKDFYIEVKVWSGDDWVQVTVADNHTNIVEKIVNNQVIFAKERDNSSKKEWAYDITGYSLAELVDAIEAFPQEKIAFLQEGLEMNLAIAAKGLELKSGLGLGNALHNLQKKGFINKDIITKARIKVAAACDARMAGLNFPVMSTMGSGNHGIEAIIPVAVMAEEVKASPLKTLQALALSHLVTAYVKQHTGKLTPICGCSVAAGVGATAASCWLMGGNIQQISGAIKNVIGNLTGMICDGAKGGCALKLSTTAGEVILASRLALAGIVIGHWDGIVAEKVEDTIKNIGYLTHYGMDNTDQAILRIMLKKKSAS